MGKYFCKPSDDSELEYTSPKETELLEFDWNLGFGGDCGIKICKIVVLGEQSTFKRQLIAQYQGSNNNIKHLEINKQIYNLQIWDVPNNVFNIKNSSMANIYCQHASAAIIVIDTTNENALNNATNLIISVKDLNKNISIIILANKWNSTKRQFNENEIEVFCKNIHHFIIWKKVETQQDEKGIDHKMVLEYDKTIKQMITKGIRSNNNPES